MLDNNLNYDKSKSKNGMRIKYVIYLDNELLSKLFLISQLTLKILINLNGQIPILNNLKKRSSSKHNYGWKAHSEKSLGFSQQENFTEEKSQKFGKMTPLKSGNLSFLGNSEFRTSYREESEIMLLTSNPLNIMTFKSLFQLFWGLDDHTTCFILISQVKEEDLLERFFLHIMYKYNRMKQIINQRKVEGLSGNQILMIQMKLTGIEAFLDKIVLLEEDFDSAKSKFFLKPNRLKILLLKIFLTLDKRLFANIVCYISRK